MKKILGVLLCFVFVSADAALIDNGNFTTDTATGLDWLDLSVTAGQSYNSAESLNLGWRIATNAEVEVLFAVLFDGYYDTNANNSSNSADGTYADQLADINSFSGLFGLTDSCCGGERAYGRYMDEDNILRMMGTFKTDTESSHSVFGLGFVGTYDPNQVGINSGVYMISGAVVPVPAAVWLFGSALGLVGFLRRRTAR